ncbi:MAG TPA: response regulator [Candidatus Acidoferrum sp.]|nr:response regulator [Candidatus Acidoferrum sp.]
MKPKGLLKIFWRAVDWLTRNPVALYALVLALSALPLLLFLNLAHRVLLRQASARAFTSNEQFAGLAVDLVDDKILQAETLLQSFASRPSVVAAWKRRDMQEIARHLEQAHVLRPDFTFFGVYDLDGNLQVVVPNGSSTMGRNFAFRNWYQGVSRSWKPNVSEIYQTAVAPHQQVFAIAVPVTEDGKPIGILMAPLAIDVLNQWVQGMTARGGRIISIVDQKGRLVAYPHVDVFKSPEDVSGFEPVRRVTAGQAGTDFFKRGDETLLISYSPVKSTGWGVLSELPATAVTAAAWDFERYLVVLSVAIIALALLFGGVFAYLYQKVELGNRFMELSRDPFGVADFNGYFRRLSPAWTRILGFSLEELTARPYLDFVHPDDRNATIRAGDALINGKGVFSFENRYRCKDGTYRWFLWNAVSVPAEKKIYAVAHDISYHKQTEKDSQNLNVLLASANAELAQQNREVERATRMKSEFLASMSHELRTPLNAIVGFSDLLGEETAGAVNPKQKRFIGHVRNGATHLLSLINDILDLSKIEAGQLEVFPENVSLQHSLAEVLSLIQPLTDKRKMALNILPEDFTIYADRMRLKQVLYNLLSNAVKFTPEHGSISVAAHAEGGQVCISVSDTGVGIRKEDQIAIFDEFRQVGESAKGVKEGTGLGLAITRRLVEQQGGTITVASEPGKGSNFTFTIPAGIAPDLPNNIAYQNSGPHEHPVVLIVDDEPTARELLMNYLGPQGYVVITAESGTEALAKAKEFRPDAITLNMLSPGQTGWMTLYELKHNPETADIPIIVVSVVDQKGMAYTLGASEYLVKPVARETLLAKLAQHVGSSRDGVSRVLVAEDEATTMRVMEGILKGAGYEPVPARNGKEAILVLERMRVDLVLLDLQMPEMDGFEVIRRIREHPQWRDLPIFVLTAKKLTDSEVELLTKETMAVFSKGQPWKEALVADLKKAIAAPKALTKGTT